MNKFGIHELRDAGSLFVRATVDASRVGSEGLFNNKNSYSCKENSSRFVVGFVFADLGFIMEYGANMH